MSNNEIRTTLPLDMEYVWPYNVERIIRYVVKYNMHVSNLDRAILLKTELMRFVTSDVFYIIVYDNHGETESPWFCGDESQLIVSLNPGACNVVIYRSHHWKYSSEAAFDLIKKEVDSVSDSGINKHTTPSDILKTFHNTNFIGLIEGNRNAIIRSANSFGREWGPGWWRTVNVLNSIGIKTSEHFIIVAGFM